jgi:hypothetical protein
MSAVVTRRDTGETLALDGVTSVRTDASWLLTEYPVGDAISDHSQRRPLRYALDVLLTETPPDGEEADPQRVQDAIDWLSASAGQLLDVEVATDREPIRSVMLEGLPRQYATLRSVALTLALREVQIVRTQSTTLPGIPATPRPSAASGRAQEADDGEQAPTEASASDGSTARGIADALGAFSRSLSGG